jgi:hypothetical protein
VVVIRNVRLRIIHPIVRIGETAGVAVGQSA